MGTPKRLKNKKSDQKGERLTVGFSINIYEKGTEHNESSKHGLGRLSDASCFDQCCSSGSATTTSTTSCCCLCILNCATKSGNSLFKTINSSYFNYKLTKGVNEQYTNPYSNTEWHSSNQYQCWFKCQ